MKKNKKLLLWVAGAFALLLAVYLWITMYAPTVNTPGKPENIAANVVYTAKNVSEVKLQNTNGTFTFIYSDAGFFLKEDNTIILDDMTVSDLFSACTNIASTVPALENPEELSVYGLQNPSATVTVTHGSGNTVFYVGDKLSADNGYYFKLADSPEIYVMDESSGKLMISGIDEFRNMSVISVSSEAITKLEIVNQGKKLSLEKIVDEESESYKWIITSFMNKQADPESVTSKILIPASSILATGIANENPGDSASFDFDISVTVWAGEGDGYTYLGIVGDTNTYARIDKLPTVYTVNTGTFAFAEITPFDILERYAYLVYLDDISGVDVTLPSGSYSMKVQRQGDEESYTVNGKAVETQQFREAYQTIVAMYVDGLTDDAAKGEQIATITFHYLDSKDLTITIHEYDNLNYAVCENGKSMFYMKKQILETIENALKNL